MTAARTPHTESRFPRGWAVVRLAEVCVQDRRIVDPGSDQARNLPYLSLEHIESETGRILKAGIEPGSDDGTSTSFLFDPRHVLYGKLRPYLNKVALPDFEGRCTTELIPLLPRENLARDWLAWLLRRKETVEAAMRQKTGSRMPRASMGELLTLLVPLPPLPEQRRIAAILTERLAAVDRARAAAEAQLEAAEALRAAYLRAIFEAPQAGIWPVVTLAEVAETCSGTTPPRERSDFFIGTVPWVKTGELRDATIQDTEEHVSDSALRETSLRLLPAGTLLVAMYGQGQTRGRTGLLARPATVNQACFAILPNPQRYDTTYLQFWFRHKYVHLRRDTEGRGGNQPNLNGDLLRNQIIPMPNLAEQRRITATLNSQLAEVERLCKITEHQLALINQLPFALLRQAFIGEL